jgi:hypothetical protein
LKPEFREKNNDIVAGFSVILGIIFAVIVGSVIVAAWGIADKVSTTEADAMGDLFKGLVESQPIKPLLIDVEWPLMRKSIKPVSGWNRDSEYHYQSGPQQRQRKHPAQ